MIIAKCRQEELVKGGKTTEQIKFCFWNFAKKIKASQLWIVFIMSSYDFKSRKKRLLNILTAADDKNKTIIIIIIIALFKVGVQT